MFRQYLVAFLCVLSLTGGRAVGSQTPSATDALTGTWTGYMARDDANRMVITVQLKLEGKSVTGTVSGPQLTPGDIRSGTFEPATGALKFVVKVRGDDGITVAFDGSLSQGVASGRVSTDAETGVFRLTRGEADTTSPPSGPSDPTVAALRRGFVEVSDWIARAADLIPADKYGYRPTASVRTLGELIGHIADSYVFYCGRAGGQNVRWTDGIEKGPASKATLTAKLKETTAACNPLYDGKGQIGPLVDNIGHASLHYGNLITSMRMLGLTPPSS
jgi:hypothetical protein